MNQNFFRGAEIILTISPGEMKSCITLYKYLYEAVTVTSETSPKSPIKSRRKCGRLDRD